MEKSDVAYIKALLWGLIGIYQSSELSNPMFWITILYIFLYGIEFIFYKYKETGE